MKIIEAIKCQSNYHRFLIEVESNSETNLFVCSDLHFDNPKCNRELLYSHLDRALEIDASIVITGDLFCMMQGKYDKRSNKSDVRPEHMKGNYLDVVINDTAEKFRKYAHKIILISKGNHETAVSNRHETDVMQRFVERLNTLEGTNIQLGEYTGYYDLQFQTKNRNEKRTTSIGYSHGNWGGVITKGTLSVMRYSAIMPDCDMMFSGHTHDGWIVTQPRLRRRTAGGVSKVQTEVQWHVKTGTYKEEFAEGKGWAVERIAVPKYLGACFVTFFHKAKSKTTFELKLTS